MLVDTANQPASQTERSLFISFASYMEWVGQVIISHFFFLLKGVLLHEQEPGAFDLPGLMGMRFFGLVGLSLL